MFLGTSWYTATCVACMTNQRLFNEEHACLRTSYTQDLVNNAIFYTNVMPSDSQDIRHMLQAKWYETLSNQSSNSSHFSSNLLSGTSPPSVFVGSYDYPQVSVGPLVPPIHDNDTSMFDSPERWQGMSLEDIINFRLSLVRGIQKVRADTTDGRYIEGLQEMVMSSKSIDSDLVFQKPVSSNNIAFDAHSAPFGPVGQIKSAKFSAASPLKTIENAYYDSDLGASDAVLNLYNAGVEISKIQKCFSVGMLGKERRLVPTRWSITATDSIICQSLVNDILDYPVIDSFRIFSYTHYGNIFCIVLFPHRWIYELVEAWYSDDGIIGFGSDCESTRGINHNPPVTAGAFFAAKLGVLEYLANHKVQAGVLVLREIKPEYIIPVGVWQVRQGIREAMVQNPVLADSLADAISHACNKTGIEKTQWFLHCNIFELMRQKLLSDFF